jgi:hypothetical protein
MGRPEAAHRSAFLRRRYRRNFTRCDAAMLAWAPSVPVTLSRIRRLVCRLSSLRGRLRELHGHRAGLAAGDRERLLAQRLAVAAQPHHAAADALAGSGDLHLHLAVAARVERVARGPHRLGARRQRRARRTGRQLVARGRTARYRVSNGRCGSRSADNSVALRPCDRGQAQAAHDARARRRPEPGRLPACRPSAATAGGQSARPRRHRALLRARRRCGIRARLCWLLTT